MPERGNKIQKIVDRYIGIPLTLPIALFRSFEKDNIHLPEIKKIGIICLGAIGDLLLLSALIDELKKSMPAAQIDLILSKNNAVAAEVIHNIDNVHAYPIKKVFQFISTLRKEQYDLLIDSSQWARVGAIISGLSKSKKIIGFKTAGQWRSLAYDIKIEHRNDCHEWVNFCNLAHDFIAQTRNIPKILVHLESENILPYRDFSPFIICHMWPAGSNISIKKWSEKAWADLAEQLIQQGFFILWSGSPADKNRTHHFIQDQFSLEQQKKMRCIAGDYSLKEMSELFTLATACISVNTGIMHLAALIGCPTLGIHGPTNPIRWGPIGKNVAAVSPPEIKEYLNLGFEKINDVNSSARLITVEKVIEQLKILLMK